MDRRFNFQKAHDRKSPGMAPLNVDKPTILAIGVPDVGNALYASPGTWIGSPGSFQYQWQRDGVDIDGQTSNNYVFTVTDFGKNITVKVSTNSLSGIAFAVSDPISVSKNYTADSDQWTADTNTITADQT